MSPRRNRSRGARREPPPRRPRLAPEIIPAPEGWLARRVHAASADKAYRCPGCNQEILQGREHVVAWRAGDVGARRHWHTPCWRHAHGTPRR